MNKLEQTRRKNLTLIESIKKKYPKIIIVAGDPNSINSEIIHKAWNKLNDNNHIYLDKMHSSIGFGLRFGLSRSAGTIVNHINFSWPLDNSMEGLSISIRSKSSL